MTTYNLTQEWIFSIIFSNTAVLKNTGFWPKLTGAALDEDIYHKAIQEAQRNISMKECSLAHELDAVSTWDYGP